MSALPSKADIRQRVEHVRFVAHADLPLRIVAAHGGLLGFELATGLVR